MKKLLMCRPDHFNVTYDINPWMSDNINKVNQERAFQQWNALFNELKHYADIKLIPGMQDLPDMVFTANAGIIQGDVAVVSRFTTKEREPEEEPFGNWFLDHGYELYQTVAKYEGEGDHLRDNQNRHWMGSGFRTEKVAAFELMSYLNTDIHVLELIDPRWYHLDTCFCPLPNGEIMWYPGAFSEASQRLIRNSFENSIEVSLEDALLFCCNCVCIGKHLFLPASSDVACELAILGYIPHGFDLSEFLKAGGAAKCLVLDCDFEVKQ